MSDNAVDPGALSRAVQAAGGATALAAALQAACGSAAPEPASLPLAEFASAVIESLPPGSARTYRPYINFFTDGWSIDATDYDAVVSLAARQRLALAPAAALPLGPRLPRVKPPANRKGRAPQSAQHLVVFSGFGHVPVDAINEVDVLTAAKWVRVRAQLMASKRAQSRHERGRAAVDSDGRGAVENFVGAMRCLFRVAGGDQRINLTKADNPARDVPKPERAQSVRRALTDQELQQAWDATRLGGNDPELDCVLFRLHVIAGARQEGALNLRLCDVRADTCELRLDEKNSKPRIQPVPPSLIADLLEHASERGAHLPADAVLRYRPRGDSSVGAPLTGRRYDTWAQRIQRALSWADAIGFGSHVLRHHAGTHIERVAGYAVACRFLGHKPEGVTGRYVEATHEEVARAVAVMTGEAHPLSQ